MRTATIDLLWVRASFERLVHCVRKDEGRWFFFAFFLVLAFGLFSCNRDDKSTRVIVYGGAGSLSGSLTVIEHGKEKFLIDCGSYYPEGETSDYDLRKSEADSLSLVFPFDPSDIHTVLLTHAHLDHIGRVPLLCKGGFKGKIYCSKGTRPILEEMLFIAIRYS
ncbi:MAG: MBL fold metallo-hydrolase, partial [Bacteroidia bacterium]|nr:MBL fold metallo-hydrolase [Bacteroidia bacterium]